MQLANAPTLTFTMPAGTMGPIDWGTVHLNAAIQVTSTSGAPSSFSVQLQTSLDGVSFNNAGSAITAVGAAAAPITDAAFRAMQIVVTIDGGTDPTVTFTVGAA